MKNAFLALVAVLVCCGSASAATNYWDINGATAGAGGATPTGNWNTTTANWTGDSTGASAGGLWTNGDAAIFSASNDATGTFVVTTAAPIVASSILVEEGIVQHTGTSTNSLTTSNLTINNGATFSVSAASSFVPTAGSVLTLNGGTIQNRNGGVGSSFLTTGSANTNMKITLGTGGGHVSVTGASTAISIYTGLIDGTGPLTIDGTNNAAFRLTTTPATYSGATIITNGGKLQVSSTANVLPAGTDLIINSGGIFDYQLATGNQTVASLSGAGNMIGSTATLTITGASSTNYSGVWSGSNRINVNKSGGTLTMSGVNTATGRFTLTNGTVDVTSTASIGGNVMDLEVNGGTLNLNNIAESIEGLAGTGGTINLATGHMLTVDPVAAGTPINNVYSGVIAGDGGLTKVNVISGTTVRTQTLAGNNTYNGNTFVNGGILSVQHANALGSTTGYTEVNQVGAVAAELLFTTAAGSVTISEPLRISGVGASNGGAIAVTNAATPTISGPVTLIGNATLAVSGAASVLYNNANAITSLANENLTLQGGAGTAPLGVGTISGAVALGSGSLTKQQGGTWVLSGTNTYTGATNINAGTLSVGSIANALGSNATINMGATTTGGNLTYTGAGETTSKVINLAGTTGGAFIVQSGTGDLKFTSDLTATGAGAKTLTLQGSTAGTGELAGQIVENGGATSVTKSGTGKWILSAPAGNSYTGATAINAGTLAANNTTGSATGSGAVTIASGGTLAGSGAVAGDVTNGGKISPGNSIDSLDLGANLSFISGGSFVAEIDSTAAFSAAADLLNIGGNLSIATGALLNLTDIAGTSTLLAEGTKFTLMSYAGTWDGGTFDLVPDNSYLTVGANIFFVDYNDTTPGLNFPGDTPSMVSYLTITAVPEPTAFVFGGLSCGLIGLGYLRRKVIARRAAVTA